MDRTTKTLELPFSKSKVNIYEYLLAKDWIEIMKSDDNRKYLIENLIVDIDGDKNNIYARVLEMHVDDYNVIDFETSKLINDAISKKKLLLNTTIISEEKTA